MKQLGLMMVCAALLFALAAAPAGAQSPPSTAASLEALLSAPRISWAQAAGFVMGAAGVTEGEGAAAFGQALEAGWLPRDARADDDARLDGVSLLVMRAFDLKGGLGFRIFKNPHYAYRELVYRRIIQDRADPFWPVSGDLLLFMIGRVLAAQEHIEITTLEE